MANSSRYRYVDWIGGRILENTELLRLQSIMEGVNSSGDSVVFDADANYREGAIFNMKVSISGLTITVSQVDDTMPMLAFVRGRWETVTSDDISSLTLSSVQTQVFLNWALNIVTYNGADGTLTDSSLVDPTTGQPTAQIGELDFTIGLTDTSGTGLDSTTQLEKNTSTIVMFEFTNSGTVLTQVILDNVIPQAYGSIGIAGLVQLTTDTADGVAVSTDDPRMTNARDPLTSTVVDASVRTPVSPGGTNADGSSVYNLTSDPGGISAAKIVWVAGTELVSDVIAYLKTSITSILSTLSSHIGVALGSSATHPMPTAAQVGAAPLSHVGLQLGLSGSHPPIVTADSGGFQVNETTSVPTGGSSTDAAYALNRGSSLLAGIIHNGDLYSTLLQSLTMVPGGSPIHFTGTPSTVQNVAQVVADHVNQNSHANPHGLTLSDLGGVSSSSFTNSLVTNGYATFPGGLIIQWGTTSLIIHGVATTVDFPIPFPSACLNVSITGQYESDSQTPLPSIVSGSITNDSFQLVLASGSGIAGQSTPCWMAIGF